MSDTRSCEWILLEGRLDAEVLAAAWDDVVAQHPLLAVRWDAGAWHASDAPRLGIRTVPHALTWSSLVPLTWTDGERDATSIDLFHGTDGDAVRIRVPHARTDAWAGAQVAQDLADAYAARWDSRDSWGGWHAAAVGPEGASSGERGEEAFAGRRRGARLRERPTPPPEVGIQCRPRAGSPPPSATPPPGGTDPAATPHPHGEGAAPWDPDVLFPRTWSDHGRALRRLARDIWHPAGWSAEAPDVQGAPTEAPVVGVHVEDLGGDALDVLRGRARAEGTSVHVLLTLAVARVCKATRILDLATVRPHATHDVSRRSDVLVVPWVLHVPHDDATARTAIRAQVDAVIKHGGARAELARLALYDQLARFLPLRAAMALTFRWITKADIASTNPGPVHVSLASFGPVRVRDFLNFPHAVPPARRLFAWTTYRGRLRLVVAWRDGRGELARAQVRGLREALGLPPDA